MLGFYQVAQLGADMQDSLLRKLPSLDLIGGAALDLGLHQRQGQALDGTSAGGHARGLGNGLPQAGRSPGPPAAVQGRRELDVTAGVQAAQGLLATGQLPPAQTVDELELLTDAPGNLAAADSSGLSQQHPQRSDRFPASQSPGHAVLIDHAHKVGTNDPHLLTPKEVGHGQPAAALGP